MSQHWMIFSTFAEQRFFRVPSKDTYNGVFLNANMVSHATSGIASFLLEKTNGLKYLIDPLTHAFQHDPSVLMNSKNEVKRSISSLSHAYGSVIESIAGKRPILPSDLNGASISELVRGCYKYQSSILYDVIMESDSVKYFDEEELRSAEPYAIIAPYFFLTNLTIEKWKDISKRILSETAKLCASDGKKLFGQIVIDKSILFLDERIKDVVDIFCSVEADGYIIWIDDFDEALASENELRGYLRLSEELKKASNNALVINKHGGYFSILSSGVLGCGVIDGVGHAPEYGEYRPVVPVGGGIPISKFYMPIMHERLKFREAAYLLRQKGWLESAEIYFQKVCKCSTCRETIVRDAKTNFTSFGETNSKLVKRKNGFVTMEFPTTESKRICLKHYLENKANEFQNAANYEPRKLLDELEENATELESSLGLSAVEYLRRWKNVLEDWYDLHTK